MIVYKYIKERGEDKESGLVVPVVPVTIEALLLYMNRKKAELFIKFGE